MTVSKSLASVLRTTATAAGSLTLLVSALGLSACGVKLDMGAINKSISDGLNKQLGVEISSVSCPMETRAAKAGDSFECEAKPKDGGRIVVKVTQKDDQGNVNWEVSKSEGLINLEAVEQSITEGMKQQTGADAKVSCGGGKLRGSKAGDTFECTATTEEGASTVTVTVKDGQGNIAWALKQ